MGNHSGAARPSSAHATTAAPLPITLPPGMAATDDEHIDAIQHELAVLARRAERIRVAALGRTESTLDRSAYLLLGRLEADGPLGIRALAEAFRLDVSTVTRQVAPLEQAGLVKRVPDPRGGRGSAIRLTAEGARQLADVRRARRERMAEVLHDWPERDVKRLAELLARFNSAMDQRD